MSTERPLTEHRWCVRIVHSVCYGVGLASWILLSKWPPFNLDCIINVLYPFVPLFWTCSCRQMRETKDVYVVRETNWQLLNAARDVWTIPIHWLGWVQCYIHTGGLQNNNKSTNLYFARNHYDCDDFDLIMKYLKETSGLFIWITRTWFF